MSEKSYISSIIVEVNNNLKDCGPILLYGENIDTGSKIGGLARGLIVNSEGKILNVGNCELTHCGVGLGIMLDGGSSALFVKQLDFLLLGLDQICNTYNYIRAYSSKASIGSFTVLAIVCDQGFQGPQSSLNAANDFFSIANIPVYCINSLSEAQRVIKNNFSSPGFRIICLSQRLFNAPILDITPLSISKDEGVFHYKNGKDVTIASFNFALNYAIDLNRSLSECNIDSALFHINYVSISDFQAIIDSCRITKKLIVIDDSKSISKFSNVLISKLSEMKISFSLLVIDRGGLSDYDYGVNRDQMSVDLQTAVKFCA